MQRYKRFLSFQGRASRLAFWRFQLASTVLLGVMMMIVLVLVPVIGQLAGVALLPMAPVIVAAVATGVRRLHDRGRSGWWLIPYAFGPSLLFALAADGTGPGVTLVQTLAALAGLLLWVWTILDVAFLRGTPTMNRFGADPMAPSPREVFA